MKIKIPEFCILALVGVSGSGKTTFARKHFKTTEVLSSDYFRSLVCDDETDQTVTADAFELLYQVATKRLARKKLTVVDATNVQERARAEILKLAKRYHCFPTAIVLNIPQAVAVNRNLNRPERAFGNGVINRQAQDLKKTIKRLKDEGFRYIYVLNSQEEIDEVEIVRERLWTNREDEHGPFDIIGDIHGCYTELKELLTKLGYILDESKINSPHPALIAPGNRRLIFLGDLVDRGPNCPEVLALVMNLVKHKQAMCIAGNHEARLLKYLLGRKVQLTHGLKECVEQLELQSSEFKTQVKEFLNSLISHYVLDQGNLVVSHAGLKEELQGRSSAAVRDFALYGETTGELDDFGFPVRANWANDYRGKALVVYGHTPIVQPEFNNNTVCIDTGCIYGGSLTALQYPEKTFVAVKAKATYFHSAKPIQFNQVPLPNEAFATDGLLKLNDTIGKKRIETQLLGPITIAEENSNAALEVMSRFAIDPRWLIYLPPTMAPTDVLNLWGDYANNAYEGIDDNRFRTYLEYPTEAIYYFKQKNIKNIIFEEKHMGSRAVMVICKDSSIPAKRFKIPESKIGVIYTRTGRPFFNDFKLETEVLNRMQQALNQSGFWERHNTDWVCLDTEIMPWSFKAFELLKSQYAAVGSSANAAIGTALSQMDKAKILNPNLGEEFEKLKLQLQESKPLINRYIDAYRRYCWPFKTIDDLQVAPFHVLATEGHIHTNQNHLWHMEEIAKLKLPASTLIKTTNFLLVDTHDETSIKQAVEWWHKLTEAGGEGCVIKSLDFTIKQNNKLLQPMIKCRGREYLRIIYGPTYTLPDKLNGLIQTRSVARKRRLALSEFALGIEALSRFVNREPLWKVHECVFGILALESEPIDPRL